MSASSNVIWRSLRRVLQAVRVVSPHPAMQVSPLTVADAEPSAQKLTATIEIVALLDEAFELDDIAAAPMAASTPTADTARRTTLPHPIARQLAYTASRNVPKGRKPQPAPLPLSAGKRAASTVRAKPVVLNTVKKAPKRRHVWLCNQSRVIRPIATNVVALTAPRVRTVPKQGSQKTIRLLKLAA